MRYENGGLREFFFIRFLVEKRYKLRKVYCMWPSSESQIDKPQRGRPKRAELPDVNINTGAQSFFYQGCGGAANLIFSGLM